MIVFINVPLFVCSLRRKFEPGAVSIDRRLSALKQLHAEGIRTYVFIGPIFPLFTDFEAILECVRTDVDFAMGESLNIRCGNWGSLELVLTDLLGEETKTYKKKLASETYWDEVESMFKKKCAELGIQLSGFFRHRPRRRRPKT